MGIKIIGYAIDSPLNCQYRKKNKNYSFRYTFQETVTHRKLTAFVCHFQALLTAHRAVISLFQFRIILAN